MATLNSIFDIVRIFSERKNNEMFKHLNLVVVNKVVVPIEGARGRGVMTLILLYVTFVVYVKRSSVAKEDEQLVGWEKLSSRKLYFDEIYHVRKKLSKNQIIIYFFLNNEKVDI